jgi:hypothetical protein
VSAPERVSDEDEAPVVGMFEEDVHVVVSIASVE